MKKRVFAILIGALLATSLVGCNDNNNTSKENTTINEEKNEEVEVANDDIPKDSMFMQLGTSDYGLSIPISYKIGDITDEDRADDMIAAYKSDTNLLDFNVYQFNKAGYPDTLSEFVEQEAQKYNGTDIKTETINHTEVISYRSVEQKDGVDYNVITYAFENGEDYIEIAFWLKGENAETKALEIINSLAPFKLKVLKLGTSNCTLKVSYDYSEGEVTDEEREDDQIAYYKSKRSPIKFDVYQFNKAGYPDTATKFIEEEAPQYNGKDIKTETINGIEVASYRSITMDVEVGYPVIVYAFEDGDDYLELVFWLENDIAEYQAKAIINSLSKS